MFVGSMGENRGEILVYEDTETIGFLRVIMRIGNNVNDDGISVERQIWPY